MIKTRSSSLAMQSGICLDQTALLRLIVCRRRSILAWYLLWACYLFFRCYCCLLVYFVVELWLPCDKDIGQKVSSCEQSFENVVLVTWFSLYFVLSEVSDTRLEQCTVNTVIVIFAALYIITVELFCDRWVSALS